MVCGSYVLSAVSTAIEHQLAGKKARQKYIKEPIIARAFENNSFSEEELEEREIQKAIMAENMWIAKATWDGLPETVIYGRKV